MKAIVHHAARVATLAAIFAAAPALAQTKQDDEEEIPAKPSATPAGPTTAPEVEAMRRELDDLKARVDAAEKRSVVSTFRDGFSLTAYLQAQYEGHQDSDDQLRQGGALLNQDRFVVRRARIRLDGDWEYAATALEIEGNTTHGMTFGLRKAEASLVYRNHARRLDERDAHFVMATLGLFDTPFGYELTESPRFRPFMERTTASRSMFPGEPDVGLRVSGALGFVRWSVAAVNGEPLDEKTGFPAQDPNAAKDVVFHFGVDAKPREELRVTGGVSALRGKGFHPGTDATKASIEWRDLNEDGVIQNIELTPIPGASATPSQNFTRWLVGADLQFRFDSRFGKTMALGEVQIGNNMDRGLFPSDPVVLGIDTRQLGWYGALHHRFPRWALAGIRYDYYEPNADVFDKRGGKLIPFSQKVTTWSPLVGFWVPHAQLLLQYDVVDNKLARDPVGVPTKLKSNTITLRLQVEL